MTKHFLHRKIFAASYFNIKHKMVEISEAAARRCFSKQVFLTMLQLPTQVFSCEICDYF